MHGLLLLIQMVLQAKGKGYAMNTSEELKFLKDIASATSVILDPVYRFVCLSSPSFFLVF